VEGSKYASGYPISPQAKPTTWHTQLPPEAANDQVLQQLLRRNMSHVGNDHSRADFVLIMKLLHWTGDNTAITRELFLSSLLQQLACGAITCHGSRCS